MSSSLAPHPDSAHLQAVLTCCSRGGLLATPCFLCLLLSCPAPALLTPRVLLCISLFLRSRDFV